MGQTADVIIVGGGVTGLSTAIQLRRMGVEKILLLERHYIGSGQSSRAAGVIRALVGDSRVASMLRESIDFFSGLGETYGVEPPNHQTGYLLILPPDQSDNLEQVIRQAKKGGCQVDCVGAQEAGELQPGLDNTSPAVYAFEPDAIWVDPPDMVQVLLSIARREGVRVEEGCQVNDILTHRSRVQGVDSSDGQYSAAKVLVATAAWGTNQLARLGVEVPVRPHRTEMAFFAIPIGSEVRLQRIVSDARSMLYLRPEGDRQMFVGLREGDRIWSTDECQPADPDDYWQSAHYDTLADMKRRLVSSFPFMADSSVSRTYACVYDYTPDAMPILDEAGGTAGLYFALGHSGGGFSLSPWVGRIMAHLISESIDLPDMDFIRLRRFAEGRLLNWSNVR